MLTAAPGARAAQGRRGIPRRRRARRLEGAGGQLRSGARRRSATSSPASRSSACSRIRTRPPAASRPRPATATSSTACCRRRRHGAAAGAVARAPRARRGDARHHRDALAGHEPARDRDGAAARDLDDPPHRGADAPAAGADGRRDHLDRAASPSACSRSSDPVDPGLADWAASYLNERLVGLGPRRADAPASGSTTRRCRDSEAAFIDALSPVFTELEERRAGDALRRGRLAADALRAPRRRLGAERADGHARAPRDAARGASRARSPGATCSSGSAPRTTRPALRSLALVAAGYGLPQRRLGTVSVIGPLRMDYGRAIRAVREAASQLSSFVADVYDER